MSASGNSASQSVTIAASSPPPVTPPPPSAHRTGNSASQSVTIAATGSPPPVTPPPPSPSTGPWTVTDSFTRADSTSMGSPWTTLSGSGLKLTVVAGIAGNAAYIHLVTADPAFIVVNAKGTNQDATCTIGTLGGSPGYVGLAVRVLDDLNNVVLRRTVAGDGYELVKVVYGNVGIIGQTTGVTPANGDVLRVTCVAQTFNFYVNGTHYGPFASVVTSDGMKNANRVALRVSGTLGASSTATFSHFSVTADTVPVIPTPYAIPSATGMPTGSPAPSDANLWDSTTKIVTDTTDNSPSTYRVGGNPVTTTTNDPTGQAYQHTIAYPSGFIDIPGGSLASTGAVVGQFRVIANTTLPAGTPANLIDDWAGPVFINELRLLVYPPGGGHFGGNESTFYVTQMDTLQSYKLYPASTLKFTLGGDMAPSAEYPEAVHYYLGANKVFDVRDHRWKMLAMGTNPTPYLLDPGAKTVEHLINYSFLDQESSTGVHSFYDSRRNIAFYCMAYSYSSLLHIEPERNKWFRHGGVGTPRDWDSGVNAIYDPMRDRQIHFATARGFGVIHQTELEANPTVGLRWLAKTRYANFQQDSIDYWGNTYGFAGLVYDPIADDFVAFCKDPDNGYNVGAIYSVDPITFDVTKLASGGPNPATNGVFNNFWYDPVRDEFMARTEVNQNIWTFKRDRSGAPPSSPTPPPPPTGPTPPPSDPTPPPITPPPHGGGPPPVTPPPPSDPTPPPVTPPPPSNPTPPPPSNPPPPSGSPRFVRVVLSAAAGGTSGVTAEVATKESDGAMGELLFNVGFTNAKLTLPAATNNVVTLDISVPNPSVVTPGDVVRVYLTNVAPNASSVGGFYSTFLIDGTVI